MGFLESYLRQTLRPAKKTPKRYHGYVTNAAGQIIWRCDCNHRSLTAATRCGRQEAAWLSRHPEQMAQLKPLPWWKR